MEKRSINTELAPINNEHRKVAEEMGDGRMSIDEKEKYLAEHGHNFFHNADFVSPETYKALFEGFDLNGKTIVNVGAGFSLYHPSVIDSNPMTRAVSSLNPRCTIIPLDYLHNRTKSWLLLDTTGEKNNNIKLEPVTGDATELPFKNSSLDGYFSSNLINEPRQRETELSFVRKMIGEAYRVLKPGGFLVISSFGYFWYKLDDGSIIYNDNIDLDEIVEKEMIKAIIEKSGFSSVTEINLDQKAIEEALLARFERRFDAIKCGVREPCAFVAVK